MSAIWGRHGKDINNGSRAGVTTIGLWHYPASITNDTIATEFAQFAPTDGFSSTSTAGVINNIEGRQQVRVCTASQNLTEYIRWFSLLVLQQIGATLRILCSMHGYSGRQEVYVSAPRDIHDPGTNMKTPDTGFRRVTLTTQGNS